MARGVDARAGDVPREGPVVQVSDLAPGGDGLARLADGRIAFVRGGLPGDTVEIVVDSERASHVLAHVRELREPSAERVSAPCPIADRCGGCPLMKLSRDGQTRAKESMLRQSLTRIGALSVDQLQRVKPLIVGERSLHYRNRLRLQHRRGQLGFFRHKTHDLAVVSECLIAAREVNELLQRVEGRLAGVPDSLAALELRVLPPKEGEGRSEISLALLTADEAGVTTAAMRSVTRALEPLGTVRVVPLRGRVRAAPEAHHQRLWLDADTFILLAPFAFNQVNLEINRRLMDLVLENAERVGATSFLDLYGGAGNFTLPLLRRGLRGVLVEVQEESVRAARRAAELQGLDGGEFIAGDVPRVASELSRLGRRADLVILDPPRKGAFAALEAAFALAQKSIILVSCDPPTLARDLRFLLDLGARLVDITPLDMFPQTHHLEVLVRLDIPAPAERPRPNSSSVDPVESFQFERDLATPE